MSSHPEAADPQHLLHVKESVVTLWEELPPEHQATMLLVLLKKITDPTMQAWATESTKALFPHSYLGNTFFPPISIDRLIRLSVSANDEPLLTADDTEEIELRMRQHYELDLFWDELARYTDEVLKEKRNRLGENGMD